MKQELQSAITTAVNELFGRNEVVELNRPDEQFGDYATNIALKLAKALDTNPREIASQLADTLAGSLDAAREVTVAGPGFINIRLHDTALLHRATQEVTQTLAHQTIVAEYSDPNPFKVLHAGHLYTSVVGDAIANIMAAAGGDVHRVNFGGDVGLHVGKTVWAILQELGGEYPDKLAAIDRHDRAQWLADCYIAGTNAYEDDTAAHDAIIDFNKQIYRIQHEADHASPLAQIYWTCRDWSYSYFDEFYASIGVSFEKYYPESTVAELGLQTVREQQAKGIFEESDGAVVFKGEPYGLHTRVFINSEGLPTYEAKDVGLIMQKYADYRFGRSMVITGNEQAQYMAVVLKAIEQFQPDLVAATSHLTHGLVKLAGGVKMSSRKGNILRATDILAVAGAANVQLTGQDNHDTMLGAVKYAFLKQRLGADIVYDPTESVAILGNTGPYLQYAHARARSILSKAGKVTLSELDGIELTDDERSLLRAIGAYNEAFELALEELMPHHLCTYLYEAAQAFNRFYERNRVIGEERQQLRLLLVELYANKLESGLALLGIPAPAQI